jgi:hypothetical protein
MPSGCGVSGYVDLQEAEFAAEAEQFQVAAIESAPAMP